LRSVIVRSPKPDRLIVPSIVMVSLPEPVQYSMPSKKLPLVPVSAL